MSPINAATDTMDDYPAVTMSRTFKAPRNRVYAAFTQAEELAKWFGPEGMNVTVEEFEFRVGGNYLMKFHGEDEEFHMLKGTFLEIVPGEKLVHTWIWEKGITIEGVETRVTLTFADEGSHTRFELVHELLPTEDARILHAQGWTSTFNCLDILIEEES